MDQQHNKYPGHGAGPKSQQPTGESTSSPSHHASVGTSKSRRSTPGVRPMRGGGGGHRPSRLDFTDEEMEIGGGGGGGYWDGDDDDAEHDEYASIMGPGGSSAVFRPKSSSLGLGLAGGIISRIRSSLPFRSRCVMVIMVAGAALMALLVLYHAEGRGGGTTTQDNNNNRSPSPLSPSTPGGGKAKGSRPAGTIMGGESSSSATTSHSSASRDDDGDSFAEQFNSNDSDDDGGDSNGAATTTTTSSTTAHSSSQPTSSSSQPADASYPPPYHVPPSIHDEFIEWSNDLHHKTEMDTYTSGEPPVNWKLGHPRKRRDRFPTVQQRIEYYMGKWYDPSSPTTTTTNSAAGLVELGGSSSSNSNPPPPKMYGPQFRRVTYAAQRTTRKFGIMSSFAVNLYNMSRRGLESCDTHESSVLHAYCRDYVDLAILLQEGSGSGGGNSNNKQPHGTTTTTANVIAHLGDSIPASFHKDVVVHDYPVYNKVRHFCHPLHRNQTGSDLNPQCRRDTNSHHHASQRIDTIVWPMNRHRHLTPAAKVVESDVPWNAKRGRAIWRGGSNDPFGMRTKWDLVGRYVNSTLVDAKFAKRSNKRGRGKSKKDIPESYVGPFITQSEQLKNRYMISIEGNDVSSGLKWMLFSNSVVLLPPTTYESWAMEGMLEPFVHYIPIKSDASDVEEKVKWAESHPQEAQRIAERSTLFIYDLLFHPDALRDEQDILQGMAERYETNFGFGTVNPVKHPLTHIHADWHPRKREDRFVSVEERTKVCLGKWAERDVPMGRDDGDHPLYATLKTNARPTLDAEFIASGVELTKCADGRGRYSDDDDENDDDDAVLRRLCAEALPFFDERLTYDLKGDRHPPDETKFKLAAQDDDLTNSQNRWFKRILIDDTVKVLRFDVGRGGGGGGGPSTITNFPVFAGMRRQDEREEATPILWQFDHGRHYDLVESGLVERLDVPFKSKKPRGVWRGGLGTVPPLDSSNAEFRRRRGLVDRSLSTSAERVDAKFLLSNDDKKYAKDELSAKMIAAEPQDEDEQEKHLKRMLSHRYIVATEDDFRTSADLKWMLLSQSVVLMPKKLRFTSWFMESHLEPHVHFVPIKEDYSDVEDQIDWCEDTLEDCEKIAERATLYVHDMLFDGSSEKDTAEVQFRIMERYSDHFGS